MKTVKCGKCGIEKMIVATQFGMNQTGGFDADGWEFSMWDAAKGETINDAIILCTSCQKDYEEKNDRLVREAKANGCKTYYEIVCFLI